ncbi:hypothetical protein L7F22_058951 [Adiantum nelumboides]|nr:hypothetical protein [Adiantum nelumboides]
MDFFMLLCHNRRCRCRRSGQLFAYIVSCIFLYSFTNSAQAAGNLGINYGRIADNLPSPTQAVSILQSISVTKTRIYDANAAVIKAFANSGISIIVGIGNEDVNSLTSPSLAFSWVETNVAVYYPTTNIIGIAVGNEVLSGNDTQLMSDLIPAMRNLYSALSSFALQDKIFVSTAHSLAVLSSSYPPSAGAFVPSEYMSQMLQFLHMAGAPFMINAYPFFAYKGSPSGVSLQYVLFELTGAVSTANAEAVVTDPRTGLAYHNMLDAQVDAVYSALDAMAYADMDVIVSETGWPSAGDADEAGASVQNAQAYNTNLINRLESGQGTPAHPSKPLQAYIFALFNEDKKPGPSSERHYGLFNPDGSRVYDFGLEAPRALTTLYNSVSTASHSIHQPHLLYLSVMATLVLFFISGSFK